MSQENKDLCKSCEHFWKDFPLPLDRVIYHCDIADKIYGFESMDEHVPYPCSECPFNSYKQSNYES